MPASHDITYDYDGVSKTTTVTYNAPKKLTYLNGAAAMFVRNTFPVEYDGGIASSWGSVSGNSVGFSCVYPVSVRTTGITAMYGNSGHYTTIPFNGDDKICEFSPKIEKTNEFEITIQGTYTMSRRA